MEEVPSTALFVRQLLGDRPTADQIVFPDAFTGVYSNASWSAPSRDVSGHAATMRPVDVRSPQLCSNQSTSCPALQHPLAASSEATATGSATSAQEVRYRGIHEALRLTYRNRIKERLALQDLAGQAIMERGHEQPARSMNIFGEPTAEQIRRWGMTDASHASWVRHNPDLLERRALHRDTQLQVMRHRRLDNLEMETYCGIVHPTGTGRVRRLPKLSRATRGGGVELRAPEGVGMTTHGDDCPPFMPYGLLEGGSLLPEYTVDGLPLSRR